MKKDKLVLGAAGNPPKDAITVDIDARYHPDVVFDLNSVPWPFEDNQFSSITCHHVIEHLNDLSSVLQELYRVCKPEGRIYIEVPHFSSFCAHNPWHKLQFSYFSLDPYLQEGGRHWMKTDIKFKTHKRVVTFHRAYRRYGLHLLFNRFPRAYERFWTYIFPAENLIFILEPLK